MGRKPRCPFKPKVPREPFTPHSPAPAQGVRPPTSQPVKCQTGLNSPRSGAELGRPGPPGPWPHLGWGGRERGVPEPPLDVKALKGPTSPAPRRSPASLLPRSQSKLSLDARPSQLCPDVPRTRAKSARPARAASARPRGWEGPPLPLCGETVLAGLELTCQTFPGPGLGMTGSAEWGWKGGI